MGVLLGDSVDEEVVEGTGSRLSRKRERERERKREKARERGNYSY